MKIGILGGGQLARMLALSAHTLNIDIICIDPDINCSAKKIVDVRHYEFTNIDAIKKIFIDIDALTYETENLPLKSVEELSHYARLLPNVHALKITQDRIHEKQLFRSLNIPTPDFRSINSHEELKHSLFDFGFPSILKTRRNGYDGKGQLIINDSDAIELARKTLPASDLILEKFLPYDFEVSLISIRDKNSNIKFYPLTLNEHKNGILRISRAPYHNTQLQALAQSYATTILEKFDYVGVMTIEFFCINGSLVANEIAPRVHNSGHWTIEGAVTSQFENHLRAISGLPLGATNARGHSAMINCIGNEPENLHDLLKIEGLHYHSYGKTKRENRKLGHITLCANETDKLAENIKNAFDLCGFPHPNT